MRTLPDPGFAGDRGDADPRLVDALTAYDAAEGQAEGDAGIDPAAGARSAVLEVLQDSRVLVPVVAVLGEVEHDEQGLAHDKSSDMAAVLMTGRDGRTALLAFTGTEALRRWNPEARPVPVTARQAAQAALQDDAAALLLDVAGPVLLVVEGEELRALAQGLRLVRLAERRWGWVEPA